MQLEVCGKNDDTHWCMDLIPGPYAVEDARSIMENKAEVGETGYLYNSEGKLVWKASMGHCGLSEEYV